MDKAQKLEIATRPGREDRWTRFTHPMGMSLRVHLGNNPERAQEICDDLTQILKRPHTWQSRHHPDLDGLHQRALDAFFNPIQEAMPEALTKLRHEGIELRFAFLELLLQRLGLSIEALWIFSKDRLDALSRGTITDDFRVYRDEVLESTMHGFTRRHHRHVQKPTPYLSVPGGAVFHKNFCWVPTGKMGCRQFGAKEYAEQAGMRPCKICKP